MKLELQSILLFIVITLIPINDTRAIVATTTRAADSEQVTHLLMNHSATNMGKKLTWRERIALKIVKWQVGKTTPNFWISDTTPSVSCSRIVMKNGKTIAADISQISKTEVRYRRCGVANDPEMIESKDDISVVLASDGTALFMNNGTNAVQTSTQGNLVTEKSAIGSAIDGIAAWIFFPTNTLSLVLSILCAIVAIIAGIIGLNKIRKEPHKYKGKGWAIAGIILGSLFLLVVLIASMAVVA